MIKKPPKYSTDPPWKDLEFGIVERVRMLYNAGFKPFASCEGHNTAPWVNVQETDVEKIHEVLMANGELGFAIDVVHSFPFPTFDKCEVYSHIRWWRYD